VSRYLHHVTLTTGHTRRSWRHEIDPGIMSRVADLIETAREETGALIPGVEPRCWLYIDDTARCAVMTVRLDDDVPLLTFAIVAHARCGAQLWRMLHESATTPVATRIAERPQEPWCAVRIEAGAILFPPPHPLLPTLADMERCVAWAWLDRRTNLE
jgi:hypothetical protein